MSVGRGCFEDPGVTVGVHAAVIAAKKNFLNQCQVVNCRVNEGDVIGYLAKSQAASWKARGRFEEKSEGGELPTVKLATSAGQKPDKVLS